MQITLNQDEILEAVKSYVRGQINIAANQDILIELRATRGETGFTATLDIVPAKLAGTAAESDETTTLVNTPTPAAVAPKAAPVAALKGAPTPAANRLTGATTNPFGKSKAAPVAAVEPEPAAEVEPEVAPEPEVEPDVLSGVFDGPIEVSNDDEPVEPEAVSPEPAPPPVRSGSIFSKVKAG